METGAWKEAIRNRLAVLKLDPAREAEITEELSQHLEDRYNELRAAGVTAEQARGAAFAELSDHQLLARELRRVERITSQQPVILGERRSSIMSSLLQDL